MKGLGYTERPRAVIKRVFEIVFPLIRYKEARQAIDRQSTVSKYRDELESDLDDYTGDIDGVLEQVVDAYWSELERSTRLDSKAGNYLRNIGVVLSVLSLAPILSVALDNSEDSTLVLGLPEVAVLIVFSYAVGALLFSAYYSTKALRMRGYSVHFSANAIKDRIEDNEGDARKELLDLLECKRSNEIHNLEKNNAISVAESFSRNGLISLGIGIALTVIVSLRSIVLF